jgi:hypothetical protein
MRLPAARYAIHGTVTTERAGLETEYTFVSHPELMLDRDATVRLDGRLARPVTTSVADRPELTGGHLLVRLNSDVPNAEFGSSAGIDVDPRFNPVYVATVPGTHFGTFSAGVSRRAEEPLVDLASVRPERFGVQTHWLRAPTEPIAYRSLPAVFGGAGRPEDLAGVPLAGRLVVLDLRDGVTGWDDLVARVNRVAAVGGAAVLLRSDEPLIAPAAVRAGPADIQLCRGRQARWPQWSGRHCLSSWAPLAEPRHPLGALSPLA